MRRVLLALPLSGLIALTLLASPSGACHFGGVGCNTPPEAQPHDPVLTASLSDDTTSAHPDTTIKWTQAAHEQFVVQAILDVAAGFDFDLNVPAQNEKLADLAIKAIVNGANVNLTGEITDNNPNNNPAGGIYTWKVTIHGTTGDIVCDAFADKNAADQHLHFKFDACQDLIDQAKLTDASALEVKDTVKGNLAAGPFVTNPSTAGDYTSTAKFSYYDDPNTPEHPPTDTKNVTITIKNRVPTTVTLSPASDRKKVNQSYTATALVKDQKDRALAGASVDFKVDSGSHQGTKCAGVITGDDGKASCTYTEATAAAPDTLKATATKFGTSASGSATIDWDKATTLTLDPPNQTRTVGQTASVTATLKDDDGQAMQGETVSFNVSAGPNSGKTGSDTSNANGQASFSYTGSGGQGDDTIDAGSNGISADPAHAHWNAVPALVPTAIGMTPEAYPNVNQAQNYMEVNTDSFTANVDDQNGHDLAGVQVHFEITAGPNQGKSKDATTDAGGNATFSYTGLRANGEGKDTIEAKVVGTNLTDTSTATWDTYPCDETEADATDHRVIHTGVGGVTVPYDFEANIQGNHLEFSGCIEK